MWQPVACCLRRKLNASTEEMQCLKTQYLNTENAVFTIYSQKSHIYVYKTLPGKREKQLLQKAGVLLIRMQ